jgi:hypothetical protein
MCHLVEQGQPTCGPIFQKLGFIAVIYTEVPDGYRQRKVEISDFTVQENEWDDQGYIPGRRKNFSLLLLYIHGHCIPRDHISKINILYPW